MLRLQILNTLIMRRVRHNTCNWETGANISQTCDSEECTYWDDKIPLVWKKLDWRVTVCVMRERNVNQLMSYNSSTADYLTVRCCWLLDLNRTYISVSQGRNMGKNASKTRLKVYIPNISLGKLIEQNMQAHEKIAPTSKEVIFPRVLPRFDGFHMTSRRPYWCTKTKEWRPYWCTRLTLLEIELYFYANTFLPLVTWVKTIYTIP